MPWVTSSEVPIWEEQARGFYADPGQFLALSGLDSLRSMLEGGSLPPPIRYLCGLQMSAVEPGSVSFTMPVSNWLLFPQGIVSGATLGFLVDVPRSGTLTARGRLIHAGKSVAVSLVEVSDDAGRLLAVASTRCTILPRIEAPREVVEQALKNPPHLTEPAWPSPHPYQRPVKG